MSHSESDSSKFLQKFFPTDFKLIFSSSGRILAFAGLITGSGWGGTAWGSGDGARYSIAAGGGGEGCLLDMFNEKQRSMLIYSCDELSVPLRPFMGMVDAIS